MSHTEIRPIQRKDSLKANVHPPTRHGNGAMLRGGARAAATRATRAQRRGVRPDAHDDAAASVARDAGSRAG